MSGTSRIQEAETLRKAGHAAEALTVALESLRELEIAPAASCMAIARCHLDLGSPEDAMRWLLRVCDAGDDYPAWQGAATLLDKLSAAHPQSLSVLAKRRAKIWLTGSYTLTQLAPLLRLAALRQGVAAEVRLGEFGQYRQEAIDPQSNLYAFDPEFVVVALHHVEASVPAFTEQPEAVAEDLAEGVAGLWRRIRTGSRARVIGVTFAIPPEDAFGHLGARLRGTRRRVLADVNARLGDKAEALGGVSLVDCEMLAGAMGKRRWFDERYYNISKQAVSFSALPTLARNMAAVAAAELGLSKKCLVLDLDNTLWGGVIGEDGLAGIKIGQGDAVSEAYLAFQRFIKALQAKGVILAVCSKNNHADAVEPFEKHAEMVLKMEDFSAFYANWERKPDNLAAIAKSLNIGMDALVFVDDNPVEREIVRQFAPDVDVVPMPEDPSGYVAALGAYLGFETAAFTAEDAQRTAQYRARAEIAALEQGAGSIEDFYRSLQMEADVAPFDDFNMPRIVQLIGKTNQFNLTTPRYSEAEVRSLAAEPGAAHFYLKLKDRFADHGLVSLIMARQVEDALDIHLWLMSCRVIGRTVEAELLSRICAAAAAQGLKKITGRYVPTAKNDMVREIYAKFGFVETSRGADGATEWAFDLEANGPIVNTFIRTAADGPLLTETAE